MDINKKICIIRESQGLSQEEFANALNLKRNSITLIETGKRNPSQRTKSDICRIFGIEREWLETGEDATPKYVVLPKEKELDELLADILADSKNAEDIRNIISSYMALTKSSKLVIKDLIRSLSKNEQKPN